MDLSSEMVKSTSFRILTPPFPLSKVVHCTTDTAALVVDVHELENTIKQMEQVVNDVRVCDNDLVLRSLADVSLILCMI